MPEWEAKQSRHIQRMKNMSRENVQICKENRKKNKITTTYV